MTETCLDGHTDLPSRSAVALRLTRGERLTRTLCVSAILIGAALSILLRALVPLNPEGFAGAYFDAGLFERSAVNILQHKWLGPFDPVTLAKGPSYSVFIAVTHRMHVPLQVGEQATYVLAAMCMALCVWLVGRRLPAATAVFLVLVFNPANYGSVAAEVIRDNWYAAVSLLFFSSLFIAVHLAVHRPKIRWLVPISGFAGLSGATYWLCREEGVWLIPSAIVVAIAMPATELIRWYRSADRTRLSPRTVVKRCAPIGLTLVLMGTAMYAPLVAVGARNERAYGVNLTTDLASGAFPRAFAEWSRVRGVPLRRWVPIDTAQRFAVYAVSPAARELARNLEDPSNGWQYWGCTTQGVCDDFTGGAEVWAFRSAAESAGHFTNEREFQAFFTRVADQIAAACNAGTLTCAPDLPPAVEPLLRASVSDTLRSAGQWLIKLPMDQAFTHTLQPADVLQVNSRDRAVLAHAITGVAPSQAAAAHAARAFQSYRWIYQWLGYLYAVLFTALLVMAVAGAVLSLFWRKDRTRNATLAVLTCSLILGIAVRLILFGVLGTTQYPIEARYHDPTRTLLLALAGLGAIHLITVSRAHARARNVGGRHSAHSGRSSQTTTDESSRYF